MHENISLSSLSELANSNLNSFANNIQNKQNKSQNRNLQNGIQNRNLQNGIQNRNLQNGIQNRNLQNGIQNRNLQNEIQNKSVKNKSKSIKNKKDIKQKKYELVDFPEIGQTYGDYKGKSPKQAAKKAFSRLARMSKLNNSNQKFIVFVIREKSGKKREFKYMGQRVKLANNGIQIKCGNRTVTIKYKNIVNKYKEL
jgi:hypothetical protein